MKKNFHNESARTNLGWTVIFSNLALTYLMAIVVLKDAYEIIKFMYKIIIKITLYLLRK